MPLPHQRHLRTGRWSEAYACYFITKCVEERRPLLSAPAAAQALVQAIDFQRQNNRLRLLAFCIMPDHYHMVVIPLPGAELEILLASIGKFTATAINRLHKTDGQFWQRGYYDHRCRTMTDIEDLMGYTELNPVRKRLVEKAEDWPHSSANAEMRKYLDWDWFGSNW